MYRELKEIKTGAWMEHMLGGDFSDEGWIIGSKER